MTIHSQDITIAPYDGVWPKIHSSAFIAPGCRIIGHVEIGPDVSIWYNCVIRGDANRIRIGARSNIQDGTVVHCDSPKPRRPDGFPCLIGEDVLIGHMAMVHGCTLEDRSFVGLGAIVMDGCTLETEAMLAAGALLSPGKVIPSRQMWMGRPAAFARTLNDEQVADMHAGVQRYVGYGRRHKESVAEGRVGYGAPER
ncbi:MAG TPA: gamma carbonic anhydrase family protein [Novosphingobium sp.]|nr:gamma carbonic anhydrase family protein [Novosphingobium sp.]HZV10824.1 gamma carbonic anhydrase family protein [Novosphingobium sp.]